jgi:hypothetical protein
VSHDFSGLSTAFITVWVRTDLSPAKTTVENEVIGWGAAGVQGPADHGVRWRILAAAMDGSQAPFWLVTTGLAWSSGGAPSRIRTCAHGSGGQSQTTL